MNYFLNVQDYFLNERDFEKAIIEADELYRSMVSEGVRFMLDQIFLLK